MVFLTPIIIFNTLVLRRLPACRNIIPRLGKYLFLTCNEQFNIYQLNHTRKTRNSQSLLFKQFPNNPMRKRHSCLQRGKLKINEVRQHNQSHT